MSELENPALDFFYEDTETLEQSALTQKQIVDTKDSLGQILDLLPVGFLIHQEQGILWSNKETEAMFGHTPSELVGQHLLDYISDDDLDVVREAFFRAFRSNEGETETVAQVRFDGKSSDDDGNYKLARLIISPLTWEGLPVVQVVFQDITDLILIQQKLERLASTDPLTGIANRRKFHEEADAEFRRAKRYDRAFSIAIIDIDHFKQVNDQHGHDVGDIALKQVTRTIVDLLRETDELGGSITQARLGGEEFALLLRETGPDGLAIATERVRRKLEETPVVWDDGQLHITVSIGTCSWQQGYDTLEDMIKAADEALYAAKNQGRNQVIAAAA